MSENTDKLYKPWLNPRSVIWLDCGKLMDPWSFPFLCNPPDKGQDPSKGKRNNAPQIIYHQVLAKKTYSSTTLMKKNTSFLTLMVREKI